MILKGQTLEEALDSYNQLIKVRDAKGCLRTVTATVEDARRALATGMYVIVQNEGKLTLRPASLLSRGECSGRGEGDRPWRAEDTRTIIETRSGKGKAGKETIRTFAHLDKRTEGYRVGTAAEKAALQRA